MTTPLRIDSKAPESALVGRLLIIEEGNVRRICRVTGARNGEIDCEILRTLIPNQLTKPVGAVKSQNKP
ncbi:hypothetical protein BISA_1757 [Bifidobacterium saguini DSM 23967]|uniref:Uncharacterized protein n=2 Tax=Bifidobacterium saguini TaxID=762210 RepID=A0A087D6L0_9BIFI|nr:hypothetical protein [Bifidobacterium saguini]KFI91160.1 hypothetical protein BISA_1757 [Bifidobacterium saguini DSM 23967]QTB91127.1 hypothetical protein BSD967_01385 [Bifidobacterium saguini]